MSVQCAIVSGTGHTTHQRRDGLALSGTRQAGRFIALAHGALTGCGWRCPGAHSALGFTGMQTAPRACRLGRRFQPPSLGGEVALCARPRRGVSALTVRRCTCRHNGVLTD